MESIKKDYKDSFRDAVVQEIIKINDNLFRGKKVSNKDKLWREYATTYIQNPTDMNFIKFISGRETEMERR